MASCRAGRLLFTADVFGSKRDHRPQLEPLVHLPGLGINALSIYPREPAFSHWASRTCCLFYSALANGIQPTAPAHRATLRANHLVSFH